MYSEQCQTMAKPVVKRSETYGESWRDQLRSLAKPMAKHYETYGKPSETYRKI